ncbi:MAG: sulfatase-like hydrolase/transferase [Verrucomicrobiales bacterium]|nr:sulfatase-like hydrolase/transferase [Verrucomicrobiales bacterium]
MNFRIAFLCLSLAVSTAAARPVGEKPNIVLIVADDLGYGELGCQGNTEIPTPHIDSIAKGGIRFTQGYVTASFCSASRAGLLTGKYQTRFGYEFNPIGAHNEDPNAGLPVGEKTIADGLVDAGYVTGIFGKWHLGGTAKYNPIRRGFDEFFGFLHEGHYFVPPPYTGATTWMRRKVLPGGGDGRFISADGRTIYSSHMGYTEPDYDADNPVYRGGQPVEVHDYLTDAFSREAADFVDRHADKPFFLYVPYNAVHSPLQATNKYMKRFEHIEDIQRRIFAAMLSSMDDGIGTILKRIQENQLEEYTLVFFISDNGGPTSELTSSNAPLRQGKGSVYEGGLRVPFLLQWPGTLEAGQTYSNPVLSLDISATALALAGADTGGKNPGDGVNLMPFLDGTNDSTPHQEIYWRMGAKAALLQGEWKLLKNTGNKWELYRLSGDISEAVDLAEAEPDKLTELLTKWKRIDQEMIEPVWSPRRKKK